MSPLSNPMKTPSHTIPVLLLNEAGEIQSRTTFSEWALDNADAFTTAELRKIHQALNATGEFKLNLGAGGTFILRRDANPTP